MRVKNYDRVFKNKCRLLAVENGAKLNKVAKRAVVLPGPQKLDVELALQLGLINKNTFIYAIEKDAKIRPNIEKYIKGKFKSYNMLRLFQGDDFRDIDYGFLDFCGEITGQLLFDLKLFFRRCASGARISLTFSASARNNHFLDNYWDYSSFKSSMNKIIIKENIWGDLQIGYFEGTKSITLNERKTIHALASALPGGSEIEWIYKYKDVKVPMLLINTVVRKL